MIDRINNEVYHISFDPLIYYENSDVKVNYYLIYYFLV